MTLGLSISAFTILHVAISLIGIGAGILVTAQLLATKWSRSWNNVFLWSTLATTVSGFMFPVTTITPALIVGAISSIALAVAFWSYYRLGQARIYVPAALFALYLNCFVFVVQAFQKVGFLNALAPTQAELPFVLAQGVVIGSIALAGTVVWRRNAGTIGDHLRADNSAALSSAR
jgi:hypothetical protein